MVPSLQNQTEIVDVLFGIHFGDRDQQAVLEDRVGTGKVVTAEDVVIQQVFLQIFNRFRAFDHKFMEERTRVQDLEALQFADLLGCVVGFVVAQGSDFFQPFFAQQAEIDRCGQGVQSLVGADVEVAFSRRMCCSRAVRVRT